MSLTERQQKWFASMQAGLAKETGRTLEEWVAIARACPEIKPRARQAWLKSEHGLGVNRASYVLSVAFPEGGWDDAGALRAALWADASSAAIFTAAEAAVAALPGLVIGQRKSFTAFSREYQFAALKPLKGGQAVLGLAVEVAADPRLAAPRNESWSERLRSKTVLKSPEAVDAGLSALLRQAWERS